MIANLTARQQLVATVPTPCAGGSYTLPIATPTVLGGVKIGANVAVALDGTISVPTGSCVQQVNVTQAGLVAGTRPTLNFIAGSKMTVTAADNPATNAVDITFVSTGGGSSGALTALAVDSTIVGQNPTLHLISGNGITLVGNLNNATQSVEATINATVVSVFGRTGAIAPQWGDYTAAQVANAVDMTISYADPPFIGSLNWSKLIGVPALVTTFNGRSGGVAPATGDYTAAMVTNAVSTASSYSDPAWLTALNWGKLTGSPSSAQVAGIQTPWLQNIDGGGFYLGNVNQIGIGVAVASVNAPLMVRYSVASNTQGGIILLDNTNSSASTSATVNIAAYGTDYTGSSSATGQLWMLGVNTGSKDVYLKNPRGGNIVFHNGAPRLTIAGGVGIIATSPTANCHVFANPNDANGVIKVQSAVASAGDYGALSFSNVATSGNITAAMKFRLVAAGSMALDFLAQSSGQTTIATLPVAMTVQAAGVGVGISTPGYSLDVGGQYPASTVMSRLGATAITTADTGYEWWIGPYSVSQATGYWQLVRRQIAGPNGWTNLLSVAPGGGIAQSAPNAQGIVDSNMANSQIQFWINEAGNALTVRVKYSTGTLKTGTVALS